MTHTCPYCEKSFQRESSIARHMCERKRRYLARDEPASRIGFNAFCIFWELHHRAGKQQTQDTFIRSAYYLAFRRFGLYCVEVRVLNPDSYVRWLLKSNCPIDKWCSDKLYTQWLIDYLTREPVTDALARSVEYAITWGADTGMRPEDILRYANISRLSQAISAGRLSPWAIYCSATGQQWLATLHETQIMLVWDYIDSARWEKILLDRKEDMCYATDILLQAGW